MRTVTTRSSMLIKLNGNEKQTNTNDLQSFCIELEFNPRVIATAVNGKFIPRDDRKQIKLSEGDQIEIFAPSQGG